MNYSTSDQSLHSIEKVNPPALPSRPMNMNLLKSSDDGGRFKSIAIDDCIANASVNHVINALLVPPQAVKQDSTSTVVELRSILEASEDLYGDSSDNSMAAPSTTLIALPTPSHSGRKWIGKWKLGRTIGEGSSGKVKLAQHSETKETVNLILV